MKRRVCPDPSFVLKDAVGESTSAICDASVFGRYS
jgi:hypothetical protein